MRHWETIKKDIAAKLSLYSNKLLATFKKLFLKYSHCFCYRDPYRYIPALAIHFKSSSDIALTSVHNLSESEGAVLREFLEGNSPWTISQYLTDLI